MEENKDLILERITKYSNTEDVVYKKASLLLTGIKENLKLKFNFLGKNGVVSYLDSLVQLAYIETTENGSNNPKNIEAIMICLSIAITLSEYNCRKYTEKLLEILKFFADEQYLHKYLLIIIEHLVLTRSLEELQSFVDPVCIAFEIFTLDNLIFSKNKDIISRLIKTYNKIFKSNNIGNIFNNEINTITIASATKYTLLKTICDKLKNYIISMYEDTNENNDDDEDFTHSNNLIKGSLSLSNDRDKIATRESESILNFISAIMQIFPVENINNLLHEINKLLQKTNSEKILTKICLIVEMTLLTKPINNELTEEILNTLIDYEVFLDIENMICPSMLSAYIKAISQCIICVSKNDFMLSLKYLPSVLTKLNQLIKQENFDNNKLIFSEINEISIDKSLIENKSKNPITKAKIKTAAFIQSIYYSNVSNIFSKLFTVSNLEKQVKAITNKIKNDETDILESLDLDGDGDTKKSDIFSLLMSVIKELTTLTDFELNSDLKLGFNVLFNLLEKIQVFPKIFKQCIGEILFITREQYDSLIQNQPSIFNNMSKFDSISNCYKVFFAKCFNLFPASYLLEFAKLDLLSFDLESQDYTETSFVWLVPYINRLLKNENIQTIADYSDFFQESIKHLLTKIQLLKNDIKNMDNSYNNKVISNIQINDIEQNMMMIDEDEMDERFEDSSSSKYVKQLKINRYQLILSQIFSLLPMFCNIRNDQGTEEIDEFFAYIDVMTMNCESIEYSQSNFQGQTNFSRKIIFQSVLKILNKLIKSNKSLHIQCFIKPNYGEKFFYETLKNLTVIISNGNKSLGFKINEESLQKTAMNCLSVLCKVVSKEIVLNSLSSQIEKVNSSIIVNNIFSTFVNNNLSINVDDNDSNIAQLNKNLDDNKKEMKRKGSCKFKEIRQIAIRVDVIIYLIKDLELNKEIYDLLVEFYKNFFYTYTSQVLKNNNPNRIYSSEDFKLVVKSFLDLLMMLLEKSNPQSKAVELYNELWNNQGLKVLTSKQKIRIFNFVFKILMKNFKMQDNPNIDMLKSNFNTVPIVIEIIALTKDINKKVRNSAYDLIAEISDCMLECNIFSDWVKLLVAFLVSKDSFLLSGVINTLARVFWQERNEVKILCQTAESIILLLKENCSEITKSIFLFIRVLVYILSSYKNDIVVVIENSNPLKNQMLNYNLLNFSKMIIPLILTSEVNKEFKVKIRNLLKCFILKLGQDEIKQIVGKENEALITYINKHIIRKSEKYLTEEEKFYKDTLKDKQNLNDSIMENDDLSFDEEEDFINNEFKKTNKKDNMDDELFEALDKWDIDEEDDEEKKRKQELQFKNPHTNSKFDKLFNTSDVELQNFFYMNPYVNDNYKSEEFNDNDSINSDKLTNKKKNIKELNIREKDDVYFDKKKSKLVVRDFEDEMNKKRDAKITKNTLNNLKDEKSMLKAKRAKDIKFDDEYDEDIKTKDKSKEKMSDIDFLNKYKAPKKDILSLNLKEKTTSNKKNNLHEGVTHYVKESGNQYKSKFGKGDILVQGKFDPYAYIQFNPKSVLKKNNDNLKLFEKIMKNK